MEIPFPIINPHTFLGVYAYLQKQCGNNNIRKKNISKISSKWPFTTTLALLINTFKRKIRL